MRTLSTEESRSEAGDGAVDNFEKKWIFFPVPNSRIEHFEIVGSQENFAYLHSSGRNFMIFLSIFKNPVPNIIRRSRCIHFRRENTADDNVNQKYPAQQKNIPFFPENPRACPSEITSLRSGL